MNVWGRSQDKGPARKSARVPRVVRVPIHLGAIIVLAAFSAGFVTASLLLLARQHGRLGPALAVAGAALLSLSVAVGWAAWRFADRRPDRRRIEAEQRLWRSGPLGRAWLDMRRRLLDRWTP